jgi:hypothetical protein
MRDSIADQAAENPVPDLSQDGRAVDPGLFQADAGVYDQLALAADHLRVSERGARAIPFSRDGQHGRFAGDDSQILC